MIYWISLFASVIANIGANLAFKHVMTEADFSMSWKSLSSFAFNPILWLAFVLCFILLGGYLFAMRSIPMGIAYTVATSLSIVGIAVSGALLYEESLGIRSVIGIALIMAGLLLYAGMDKQDKPADRQAKTPTGPPVLQPAHREVFSLHGDRPGAA